MIHPHFKKLTFATAKTTYTKTIKPTGNLNFPLFSSADSKVAADFFVLE